MATLYELVESVYNEDDLKGSHPYRSLKSVLDSLKSSASSKSGIFTDGLSGGTPPNTTVEDAIELYEGAIVGLNADIEHMKINDIDTHYDVWWKENPSADNFSSYKITPNVLTGGDKTKEKILTESGMPLPSESDTFFYKGRQTWADDIGNLAGWVAQVNAQIVLVDNIVGELSATNTTNINIAKSVITNAKSEVNNIKTNFNNKKAEEIEAWDDAIRYNQAYAYISFLENNSEDAAVQDLKNKFSNNLPS